MQYDINSFWIPRLRATSRVQRSLMGWHHINDGLKTFLEAPLTLGSGYGEADPRCSNIILVSAPGAVGKTTLAKEIAYRTGSVYVDLAEAAAVGASTMTGGLAKTTLYEHFLAGKASVLVDGLDEARIRVTQAGFSAFLEDLVDLVSTTAETSRSPVILFGRTGAVEEAWLLLNEHGLEAPVLEIGYYDFDSAKEFAEKQAEHIRSTKHEPDSRAIELLLNQLHEQTLSDGTKFIGYSPVLIAVAKRVADHGDLEYESNTAQLISRLESGEEDITLIGITQSILQREQRKIESLELTDSALLTKLYSPEEQLDRLIDRVYGHGVDFTLPAMSPEDRQSYEEALDTWVGQHPFLDGLGRKPSSAVFGGLIAARALNAAALSEKVLLQELGHDSLVNPFLSEFYVASLKETQQVGIPTVPSRHIGLVYASLSARLGSKYTTSLRIDADAPSGVFAAAEVEVVVDSGEATKSLEFTTEINGVFVFGRRVHDLTLIAREATLTMGGGSELTLLSPISVEVDKLTVNAKLIAVEQPMARTRDSIHDVVDISARDADVSQVSMLPRLAEGVKLEVRWPGSENWPWSTFRVDEEFEDDQSVYDGINALLRIVRLFKSKGKGNLAKYSGAIDHHRRTYGLGKDVRDHLLREQVLRKEGQFYFLEPDKLMEKAGLEYNSVRAGVSNECTREFVRRALKH